jgi:hypothetical protein
MRRVLVQIAVIGVWLSSAGSIHGQPDKSLIEYSIVGSINAATPSKLNPFVVLGKVEVQRVLLDVARSPRDQEFIDRGLESSAASRTDLETLGLIRRVDGKYVVGFSLFAKEDEARVRAVASNFARALATVYSSKRPAIEAILKRYPPADVDRHDLAFVLLGCFSLDWDGLALTEEKNYRSVAKLQPGGNRYSIWAKEKDETSLQRVYWGSTTDVVNGMALTTFGDHHSLPRNAFPDLSFRLFERIRGIDVPDTVKPQLVRAGAYSLDGVSGKVVTVMKALRNSPATEAEIATAVQVDAGELRNLLSLLIGLDYVTQSRGIYSVRIPVLTKDDMTMVNDLRSTSRKILEAWLSENYGRIKSELKDLTPLKYGVPFEDLFTHIWHYIFGLANREMVELGMLADPYGNARVFKGFVPVIWDTTLAKLP